MTRTLLDFKTNNIMFLDKYNRKLIDKKLDKLGVSKRSTVQINLGAQRKNLFETKEIEETEKVREIERI